MDDINVHIVKTDNVVHVRVVDVSESHDVRVVAEMKMIMPHEDEWWRRKWENEANVRKWVMVAVREWMKQ